MIPEMLPSGRLASRCALAASVALVLLGSRPAARAEVRLYEDVVYSEAGGEELRLDLALPPEGTPGPHPAIICIHGGGWRGGDRRAYRSTIRELAERGYAAATVSYRFAPAHPWPAQMEDVRAALRWLRAHAAEHGIDARRVGATGFSAGGHLSLVLGLRPESDDAAIQAVVNYFGPVDVRPDVWSDSVDALIADLAGGSREDRPDAYADISPLAFVTPGAPPVLTFHGTDDPLVPIGQARALHQALDAARVPNALEVLEGRGHGWVGEELSRTQRRAFGFFDLYLMGSSLPILVAEDFDGGAGRWEPTDAAAWEVAKAGERAVYSLVKRSQYKPPVRSPEGFSLFRDVAVTDFTFDVLVRSTTRDYGHRDLCVIFGHQDPSHFYYVHLAKSADAHAHSIFIVNGEPRVSIAEERTGGIDWDDGWHGVRVRRDTATGLIEVFFDDLSKPIMRTHDSRLLRGRIGVGSFDDTADFTEIRLRGRTELPSMTL